MADGNSHWTVDKKIPLALIFAIMLQTVAGVWWAATTTSRLDTVEKRVDRGADLKERVIRLEVISQNQTVILQEILTELRKHK